MALRVRVKEVARQRGFSMGKLQRDADVAYNTVKRMYKNPYHVITTETLGKRARGSRACLLPIAFARSAEVRVDCGSMFPMAIPLSARV